VFALALGYEDVNERDTLRHEPVIGALLGNLSACARKDCVALAEKSTLSCLECYPAHGTQP
jgi:hypothetical protein